MNALTTQQTGSITAQTEEDLIRVLQNSLYPGASIGSVQMVLGYCQAAGLDPMQKPVHLVPMWDGKAKQMRDVVMPGVNLYRTQASRTGIRSDG
jgi:phage recombination protein Bet